MENPKKKIRSISKTYFRINEYFLQRGYEYDIYI